MKHSLQRRVVAEFIGCLFLLSAVVGSGIMGERLAGGNIAIALLANTIATGWQAAGRIFLSARWRQGGGLKIKGVVRTEQMN